MLCKYPPALTDDDLSAVLDGQAPVGTAEHLADCPDCAARLERARRYEHALKTALYRWDCPSTQHLGRAELGLLAEPERRALAQHLSECHACAAEVEQLRGFMAAAAIADVDPMWDQRRRAATEGPAELVAAVLPRGAAVAVRGEAAGPIVATASGITIVLDPQFASPGHALVRGQVAADDQGRWTGALVELRQAGRVQAMATVDESGGFRCGPLAAGRTDLRITPESGQPVLLPGLSLGGEDPSQGAGPAALRDRRP